MKPYQKIAQILGIDIGLDCQDIALEESDGERVYEFCEKYLSNKNHLKNDEKIIFVNLIISSYDDYLAMVNEATNHALFSPEKIEQSVLRVLDSETTLLRQTLYHWCHYDDDAQPFSSDEDSESFFFVTPILRQYVRKNFGSM